MKVRRRRGHDSRLPKVAGRERVDEVARWGFSPTAVAAEALRTGVLPSNVVRRRHPAIPHEDAILLGDPDDGTLANAYVGEDTPGGSSPTPDQNLVDEIGRAYGLLEEDSGALRSGAEVLGRRDRRRSELTAPGRRP